MNVRRLLGFIVIALLLFFIFTQPDSAATSVQNIGTTLRDGANSVTHFFTRLV